MRRHPILSVVVATLASAGSALGQKGDEKDPSGTVQADPPAWMQIPDAPVRSPAEALATFTVEPGYRIELVASEPLVQDPVSIRFDAHGRMWVVEMRGFMPNADGEGEKEPVGTIAVLEDTDGDRVMDRRTDFLDRLAMPRAVLPLGGGEALVLVPPHFVHAKDIDGDLVADERTELGIEFPNGFTDPEHAANSPTFGLDNWIYLSRFDRRLRLRDSGWEIEPVAFGGQWGLSMDDRGRWFFNTNSDHLRAHFAPPHYDARHPHLDRAAFGNQRVGQSQEVWPIRVTPGVNRGYKQGTLREDGTLRTFTAVCGPAVYRGDLMPELRGDVFVVEPSAHLIRRDVITADGTAMRGANAYPDREFVASTDERFRPVDLHNGPDGALYVVDMYRGLIQHRNYLTSYLRRQVEKRGLAAPIHMGRIWRIVPDRAGAESPEWVVPARAVSAVELLEHENGWVRDTAQRLLVRAPSRAYDELGRLRDLARTSVTPAPRLHAMWTLEGIGALDRATVLHALRDPFPVVREHAARLAERWLAAPIDTVLLGILGRMAAEEDDALVTMQLAFTLGAADRSETPYRDRAEQALVGLLTRGAEDPRLRDAVISGLAGVEVGFLHRLCADPRWTAETRGRAVALSRLSSCVIRARQDGAMRALLSLAADDGAAWRRGAMLEGIGGALPRAGTKKLGMAGRPEALDRLAAIADDAVAEVVARIEESVDFTMSAGARALTPDEQVRFDRGASLYAVHCTQCHQPGGTGMDGLAPPLAGSEWVLGSPARLVRIVLHGLSGPIEVAGRSYDFPLMPDHGKLADDELAAVLTYVRRAWENEAEPVEAAVIGAVRAMEKDRGQPWTAAELESVDGAIGSRR